MHKPHKARKRFGQNFLHDIHIINDITMSIAPQSNDHLIEIGPGQGAITEPLLDTGCTLDVIELDRDLVGDLERRFADNPRFTLHNADALSFNYATLTHGQKMRIVGNLPYNISTPLIFHLLEHLDLIQDMHFMLQKEIVNRLQAQPGCKQYGRLSIMVQLYCNATGLFDVEPTSFSPQPKVMSSIIRLTPHSEPLYHIDNKQDFNKLVTTAFSQRRKTIRNSLKSMCTTVQIEQAGITLSQRAEDIAIDQFVSLANILGRNGVNKIN
jgi:16S rRNA (adenine1518-N6/adenine1519-N6)-dimethyltransferase